jgi:hypothetical protein
MYNYVFLCICCCYILLHFRYKSQYAKHIRDEYHVGRLAHRTMGEAHADLPPPEQFLRKNARENKFAQRAKSARVHSKFNVRVNFPNKNHKALDSI